MEELQDFSIGFMIMSCLFLILFSFWLFVIPGFSIFYFYRANKLKNRLKTDIMMVECKECGFLSFVESDTCSGCGVEQAEKKRSLSSRTLADLAGNYLFKESERIFNNGIHAMIIMFIVVIAFVLFSVSQIFLPFTKFTPILPLMFCLSSISFVLFLVIPIIGFRKAVLATYRGFRGLRSIDEIEDEVTLSRMRLGYHLGRISTIFFILYVVVELIALWMAFSQI